MTGVRPLSALAAAVLALATVAGCGNDDDDPAVTTTTTTEADALDDTDGDADDATDDETDGDEDDATGDETDEGAAGDGDLPEWAEPFEIQGDLIATIDGDTFTVDVYQVGVEASPRDGSFVDPDTNEPILAEGDDIVVVSYVFTNTGDDTISLPFSLVTMSARYADWPWLQGMEGTADRQMLEQLGVNDRGLATGMNDDPFEWAPGESFSYAESFAYQPGSAITFTARLTPADESGNLLHDERQEFEAEATIE